MRHLRRNVRLLRDLEQLIERRVDVHAFVAHVRRVNPAVAPGRLRERDQLVGLRVARGGVFQRSPDAQRPLLHQRVDNGRHLRQFRRRRCAILFSDDRKPHLRRAHERRDVQRRSLLLELREIAAEVAPILAVMPLLHRVRIVEDQLVGQRRDRAALSGHFGGDALRDLREHPVIDEDVGLGLAHHVDEPRRNHEAGHVHRVACRGSAEESHGGDPIAAQRHVAAIARVAAAVDDPATLQQDIVGSIIARGGRHATPGDQQKHQQTTDDR